MICRIFPLSSSDEVIMVLDHPQSVFLRGKASVRSLQGRVSIHGFLVKPGGVYHPFYSPDCSSLLAVSTVADASPVVTEVSSGVTGTLPTDYVMQAMCNEDSDTIIRVLNVVDTHSVVLIFKRLECHVCSYVASIKPFTQLFSGVTRAMVPLLHPSERWISLSSISSRIRA